MPNFIPIRLSDDATVSINSLSVVACGLGFCLQQSTALHFSCWHGHAQLTRMLLEAGASIEARTQDGDTALHQAVFGNHRLVRLVPQLLERITVVCCAVFLYFFFLAAQLSLRSNCLGEVWPLFFCSSALRTRLFPLQCRIQDRVRACQKPLLTPRSETVPLRCIWRP